MLGWMMYRVVPAVLFLAIVPVHAGADDARQTILGWVEYVQVDNLEFRLKAKLDTGATTSSIDARDIELFEKEDEDWVRFKIPHPEEEGKLIDMEREVARMVRIIRHNGEDQRRAVIRLTLCIGDFARKEDVSLVDRSEFIYPLLVGRNHMEGRILVDPGATFQQDPDCATDKKDKNE